MADVPLNGMGSGGDSSVGGTAPLICWFCKKGRHGDCMGGIPVDGRSDGPHDCTFDTKVVRCGCDHR